MLNSSEKYMQNGGRIIFTMQNVEVTEGKEGVIEELGCLLGCRKVLILLKKTKTKLCAVSLGYVLDPAKCSNLPLEEKREFVREIAKLSSDDAPVILSSFSRKELLEIICAEMGKERKYSGFTKLRMIDHLLKLISENSKRKSIDNPLDLSAAKCQSEAKKQRRNEHPVQLSTNQDHVHQIAMSMDEVKTLVCPNLACKATLHHEDGFCKRCSCCICHHYDDNKDPSLWLTCDSDFPSQGEPCGMSCHLRCALRHERAGIMKNGKFGKLDGKFSCVSCGKINDLMSTWRKQLLVAKDARRVDVLCSRISLSHKILDGTERYKDPHKRVDTAAKKLRKELGPLDRVCEKMGRGIVNRLSCGTEVQKLCASALEAFDVLMSRPDNFVVDQKPSPSCIIRFEESFPTSVVIVLDYDTRLFEELLGCRLWHRKSSAKAYPEKPTYIVLKPEKRFKICDLEPCREYSCLVSLFSCTKVFGTWEAKWITPPSIGMCVSVSVEQMDKSPRQHFRALSACDNEQLGYMNMNDTKGGLVLSSESIPTTPCKVDGRQVLVGPWQAVPVSDYEYCVRVIKSLEHEGHLNVDFRVKFLTWFSLKATMQERRVVSAFVDAMANDPASLTEQLIDAFADEICSDRKHLF